MSSSSSGSKFLAYTPVLPPMNKPPPPRGNGISTIDMITMKCLGMNLYQDPPPTQVSPVATRSPKYVALRSWFETKVLKKPIDFITTKFLFEFRIGNGKATWSAQRTSDEMKELCNRVHADFSSFQTKDFLLELGHPSFEITEEESSNVMLIVDMQESGGTFLAKILQFVDFLTYQPLAKFIDVHKCIEILSPIVRCIQKVALALTQTISTSTQTNYL